MRSCHSGLVLRITMGVHFDQFSNKVTSSGAITFSLKSYRTFLPVSRLPAMTFVLDHIVKKVPINPDQIQMLGPDMKVFCAALASSVQVIITHAFYYKRTRGHEKRFSPIHVFCNKRTRGQEKRFSPTCFTTKNT